MNNKNTQNISREKLAELYTLVCDNWKREIVMILANSTNKNIAINNSLINKAYTEADDKQKKILDKLFIIEKPKDIYSKYNTWEKVKEYYGRENCKLPYTSPSNNEEKSINNRIKLARIIKLYNGDYIFDWNNTNQYKYSLYKYFSDGSWVASSDGWFGNNAHGPVDLVIKDRETCNKIIQNFPEIIKGYFMI